MPPWVMPLIRKGPADASEVSAPRVVQLTRTPAARRERVIEATAMPHAGPAEVSATPAAKRERVIEAKAMPHAGPAGEGGQSKAGRLARGMVTAANVNLGVNEAWLRQVRCIDALDLNVPSSQQHQAAPSEGSSHQGETAPAVIIYVGGGTTPLEQVNDTQLHGGLKKAYEEQRVRLLI